MRASASRLLFVFFSLEKQFRNVRAMDESVHANQHRMAFRGNATSFPMPWEDLMVQLRDCQESSNRSSSMPLPRSGIELANVVSILLKSAGGDNDKKAHAKLIHQATVRRHIVVRLIEEMKQRGHKAYVTLDMDQVKVKASSLPENGVPPEIIRLLPLDKAHDVFPPSVTPEALITPGLIPPPISISNFKLPLETV